MPTSKVPQRDDRVFDAVLLVPVQTHSVLLFAVLALVVSFLALALVVLPFVCTARALVGTA